MPADFDLLDRVRRARRQLAEHGPARSRSEDDFRRVSIPDSDGDVLRDLLLDDNPRVVVEIGLAYGSSALAVAEALVTKGTEGTDGTGGVGVGVRQVIVDPFQDQFYDAGWNLLLDTGLGEICELLRERSQLALPRLIEQGFVADAAFVDGSHIFHNVFLDLAFLREIVRPGGLVVLDDCQWPSVATAVRYFELNTGWQPQPIDRQRHRQRDPDHGTRLRAYRLPDPRVEPKFEAFRPFDAEP